MSGHGGAELGQARPTALLVWLPLCYSLLVAPVSDPTPGRHSAAAWLLAGAAAIAFTATTLTRYWRPRERADTIARLLLALLAALALVTTVGYSPAWSSLFILLAIGVGVVLRGPLGPSLILAIGVVATTSSLLVGAPGENALTTGLSVLLAGFGTYAIYQLFAVVAELQCTREELARMAVSQERERFARDLHDLLGHTLSVIVVKPRPSVGWHRSTLRQSGSARSTGATPARKICSAGSATTGCCATSPKPRQPAPTRTAGRPCPAFSSGWWSPMSWRALWSNGHTLAGGFGQTSASVTWALCWRPARRSGSTTQTGQPCCGVATWHSCWSG